MTPRMSDEGERERERAAEAVAAAVSPLSAGAARVTGAGVKWQGK